MAFKLADWIKDTSTTTGTDDFALVGAFATFRSFDDVLSDGDTTHYTAYMDGHRESGLGTYNATTGVLARTIVFESTNGGAKVSFPAGTKVVECAPVGSRMLTLDGPSRAVICATKAGVDQAVSAAAKLTFSATDFNDGGFFSAVDSRFTPPAGKYRLSATFGVVLPSARSQTIEIRKNGTAIARGRAYAGSGSFTVNPTVTRVVEANGTDYFEAWYASIGDSFTVLGAGAETWFCGESV